MLFNVKYKQAPPDDDEKDLNWSPNPILEHLPLYQRSPRLPTSSSFENDFLIAKKRESDMKAPTEIPNLHSIRDEVDILLKQFENI